MGDLHQTYNSIYHLFSHEEEKLQRIMGRDILARIMRKLLKAFANPTQFHVMVLRGEKVVIVICLQRQLFI
jgi:hypothetical protein